MKFSRLAALLGAVTVIVVSWGLPEWAVSQVSEPLFEGDRFTFDVIESFDARYDGDTPGHMGLNGGLGEVRPLVAIGDPVYRGECQVGVVTALKWGRAHGSLEVEFDAAPKVHVSVGEVVWLRLGGKSNDVVRSESLGR